MRDPHFRQLRTIWKRTPRGRRELPDIYHFAEASLREIPISGNERLGSLAHSRPALEVMAPALFRHMVYFFAPGKPEHDPLLHPGSFERDKTLNGLSNLVERLTPLEKRIASRREIRKRFQLDQSCVLHLSNDFHGFKLRAVIDVYSEYATMTLVLDRNKLLADDGIDSKPDALADWIRKCVVNRKKRISEKDYARKFEADYPASEAVFFGIWDLLDDEFSLSFEDETIGRMVGDFRGFAVWPDQCKVAKPKTPPKTNREDDKKYHFSAFARVKRPEQNVMQFLERERSFFLDCLGLHRTGIIRARKPARKKRLEPNIILCRMMDGDVIYGSALGSRLTARPRRPQPRRSQPPVNPITYFVIHNGISAHQLGRMIRRQNLLGELRLAALFDAEAIIRLGPPIRRLSGLVAHLLSHGTRLSAISRKEFQEALKLYTEIGRKCHGGLSYRMARATYYYEALQTRLKDTRSHAIQGWQSYPGFITRHFDQRFRSMRSTGQRYTEVGTRIERLYALYVSERQRIVGYLPVAIGTLGFAGALSAAARETFKTPENGGEVWLALSVFCFTVVLVYWFLLNPPMASIQRKLSRKHSSLLRRLATLSIAAFGIVLTAYNFKRFMATNFANQIVSDSTTTYRAILEWLHQHGPW